MQEQQRPQNSTNSLSQTRLLGERDARKQLGGIGHTLFWSLIKKNELQAVRIGRRTLVTSKSIEDLIVRNAAVPQSE